MILLRLFKQVIIVCVGLYLSACYPMIYGVSEELWATLTEDQRRTTMENYYERERLNTLRDNMLQIERERRRAEEVRWRVEEAEQRAREAEQRARDAEQRLREECEKNERSEQNSSGEPTKRFGHGRVTKE